MSKIKVVAAVCALMAFALAWVLVTQDRTDIWNVDPTVDLPEMASSLDDIVTQVAVTLPDKEPPPPAKPVSLALILLLASFVVSSRRVMQTASPTTAQGYSVPLCWLLANPKTAPPRT